MNTSFAKEPWRDCGMVDFTDTNELLDKLFDEQTISPMCLPEYDKDFTLLPEAIIDPTNFGFNQFDENFGWKTDEQDKHITSGIYEAPLKRDFPVSNYVNKTITGTKRKSKSFAKPIKKGIVKVPKHAKRKTNKAKESLKGSKPLNKGSTKLQVQLDSGKRAKWTKDEVTKLWKGIERYGNNWVLIQQFLSKENRSYEQVKDKGRRILFNEGWKTGRKKEHADEAMHYAKSIANAILGEFKAGSKQNDASAQSK